MGLPAHAVVMTNPDDPDQHRGEARCRPDGRVWDTTYYRGGEVVSEGAVSTPPPHVPPVATLKGTLDQLAQEQRYWRDRTDDEEQMSPWVGGQ